MGFFNHHTKTDSNLHASKAYHMDQEDETKTAETSKDSSSGSHTSSSAHASACGCGCGHKTKPVDEEVVEIKEEWDY